MLDKLMGLTKAQMVSPENALPGRAETMPVPNSHYVLDAPLCGPFPEDYQQLVFGMGCFWGAEKIFWQLDGVYTTAVGYAAGYTPNPSYEEVCSGLTGHNEVVLVVFDPKVISAEALLIAFWEGHDPTQVMQQGNDRGTQYRSGIYCDTEALLALAESTRDRYGSLLDLEMGASVATEIKVLDRFYYAEDYHQQYLAKNPNGYCGHLPIELTGRPRFPV